MKIPVLATLLLALLPATGAWAQPGALTQRTCVSESGSGGRCADGSGLGDAAALAISPDGRNVYVVAPATQSLAVFSRDAASGGLTERSCLTLWAAGGDPQCARVPAGLTSPVAVTVSGDGLSVYVANIPGEITVFRRDPATGALSQPTAQPCIGSSMAVGCPGSGTALGVARDVVVGAGGDVYVAASSDEAIGELRRDAATSVLTQPAGRPACISRDGLASSTTGKAADCTHASLQFKQPTALALTPGEEELLVVDFAGHALWSFPRDPATGVLDYPGCYSPVIGACGAMAVHGMQAPADVAVTPDGRHVYVASTTPGGIAVLTRGANGLAQASTGARHACVSNDGGEGCVQGRALDGAVAVAIAPDGRDVYVAAPNAGALDTFARDAGTGGLRQLDGLAGCLSYDGAGGICTPGALMEGVRSLVVSPDGRNVYAVSRNHGAVLAFDREQPAVATPPAPPVAPDAPVSVAPPAVAAPATPAITAFTASPRRFRTATRLRWTLTAPATVRITVARRGRVVRTLIARPGIGTLRLSGRRLRPGRYVVTAEVAGRRVRLAITRSGRKPR